MRTVTRSAGLVSARCSQSPKSDRVNRNTTNFATVDNTMMDRPTQVQSSLTMTLAKILSRQINSSTPPSAALPWSAGVFAKVLEEERKADKLRKTFVFSERQGKIVRAWEPVEKELWLERFGGPGKAAEKVAGNGLIVLRDVGADGKGYLRVLI